MEKQACEKCGAILWEKVGDNEYHIHGSIVLPFDIECPECGHIQPLKGTLSQHFRSIVHLWGWLT